MRSVIRYSEAFKLQVIRQLEEGRFGSACEASCAYGIKGAMTVGKWLRRYGKDHLLGKVIIVMKADEQTELNLLRKQVRDLKGALADAHLDLKIEAAYVKLACKAAGVQDVVELKKKHAGTL